MFEPKLETIYDLYGWRKIGKKLKKLYSEIFNFLITYAIVEAFFGITEPISTSLCIISISVALKVKTKICKHFSKEAKFKRYIKRILEKFVFGKPVTSPYKKI